MEEVLNYTKTKVVPSEVQRSENVAMIKNSKFHIIAMIGEKITYDVLQLMLKIYKSAIFYNLKNK